VLVGFLIVASAQIYDLFDRQSSAAAGPRVAPTRVDDGNDFD
jgi:hypothetical protein